jgi:hypothetical protein
LGAGDEVVHRKLSLKQFYYGISSVLLTGFTHAERNEVKYTINLLVAKHPSKIVETVLKVNVANHSSDANHKHETNRIETL